ncbi:uncharacterized protein TNCV_3906041 [Trichonephila clavipes]|nr:uncharacterized protein TNCV_3906041 [Trichonephila clavipes]
MHKDLPAKIARWALMLEEFDYEVCHRPGRQMKHTITIHKKVLQTPLLFTVIDSFSKFVDLPCKVYFSTKDALDKLILQQTIFVAIQRTQFGTGLKLRPKYFGPYEVTKVNKHDRYEVQKIGQHEGPNFTCSPAPRTAWSSGCPCGYQLLADHFRSHDRTEVTRGSQRDGETVLFPPP